MDKILVVVFDSESQAYEGSRTLQELHDEGSIHLYAKAVMARDAGRNLGIIQSDARGPVGTGVGLLTGSLIGLLSGPARLSAGAGTGMFGGVLNDLARIGIGEDFLYKVGQSLQPGKAALVAEVWEEWELPVDTRMEALGGILFRRTRRDILDAHIERDVAALRAELAERKSERDQASGEAKAKLQAKIDAAKAKLQAMQDGIQARIETSKQEMEAKIRSLQEQADTARGLRKAKLEVRIAELQSEQKRRSDLLKQAWELTKEALSP